METTTTFSNSWDFSQAELDVQAADKAREADATRRVAEAERLAAEKERQAQLEKQRQEEERLRTEKAKLDAAAREKETLDQQKRQTAFVLEGIVTSIGLCVLVIGGFAIALRIGSKLAKIEQVTFPMSLLASVTILVALTVILICCAPLLQYALIGTLLIGFPTSVFTVKTVFKSNWEKAALTSMFSIVVTTAFTTLLVLALGLLHLSCSMIELISHNVPQIEKPKAPAILSMTPEVVPRALNVVIPQKEMSPPAKAVNNQSLLEGRDLVAWKLARRAAEQKCKQLSTPPEVPVPREAAEYGSRAAYAINLNDSYAANTPVYKVIAEPTRGTMTKTTTGDWMFTIAVEGAYQAANRGKVTETITVRVTDYGTEIKVDSVRIGQE